MFATIENTDFDLKLAEFKINGYAVFDDMIPLETVDRIRDAFMPLLEHVMERDGETPSSEMDASVVETGDVRTGLGRLQTTNRYTLTLPWMPPFSDPAVYEHPVLLEFLDRYWKTDDYLVTCYHSNNPYPGSKFQNWHRDTHLGSDIPHVGLETVPVVGVKFPLVDTSEHNGSIEVLPITQYLADPDLEGQYNEILTRGHFPSSHRLNLKKGSMWVQDVRTLHRGTPNHSDYPRPELVVCYCRSWFRVHRNVDISQSDYDALTDRGKNLMSRCNIVEASMLQ